MNRDGSGSFPGNEDENAQKYSLDQIIEEARRLKETRKRVDEPLSGTKADVTSRADAVLNRIDRSLGLREDRTLFAPAVEPEPRQNPESGAAQTIQDIVSPAPVPKAEQEQPDTMSSAGAVQEKPVPETVWQEQQTPAAMPESFTPVTDKEQEPSVLQQPAAKSIDAEPEAEPKIDAGARAPSPVTAPGLPGNPGEKSAPSPAENGQGQSIPRPGQNPGAKADPEPLVVKDYPDEVLEEADRTLLQKRNKVDRDRNLDNISSKSYQISVKNQNEGFTGTIPGPEVTVESALPVAAQNPSGEKPRKKGIMARLVRFLKSDDADQEDEFDPESSELLSAQAEPPQEQVTESPTVVIDDIGRAAVPPESMQGQIGFFDGQSDNRTDQDEDDSQWEETLRQKRRKKASGFVLAGEEETTPQDELASSVREPLDDFTGYSQAETITSELKSELASMWIRFFAILMSTAALLWIGLAPGLKLEFGIELPFANLLQNYSLLFIIINIVITLFALIVCSPVVLGGLGALPRLTTNGDTATAVASVITLAHTVLLLGWRDELVSGSIFCYAPILMICLLLNTIGKMSFLSRVARNFTAIKQPGIKQSAMVLRENEAAAMEMRQGILGRPVVAMPVRAGFLSEFLETSYQSDSCDRMGGTLAPAAIFGSLAVAVGGYLTTGLLSVAVSAFAAVSLICVPAASLLGGNWCLGRAAKKLRRQDAMITGYTAVETFSGVNGLAVNAEELFPQGQVVLNNIKTFGGERIDLAILDAAAITCTAGGPLASVFDIVIEGRREILPPVDTLVYEQGMGLSGWVSGRRVLVGNRELMANHGVETPSRDYENRFNQDGRKLVYLSVSGELSAMFIVSYLFSEDIGGDLIRMDQNGVNLMIRTCDPNVTPEMVAEGFGIDAQNISIMSAAASRIYNEVREDKETVQAAVSYSGKIQSLMSVVTACIRLKGSIQLATVIQAVAVLLGFAVAAFLAFYSGLSSLSPVRMAIYHLCWVVMIWILPAFRRL